MKGIWYYAEGAAYPEDEPKYYNAADFSSFTEIEKHWHDIKQELVKFIIEKDAGFQANSYQGVKIKGSWNSLPFIFWGGILSNELYRKCPVLASYLKQIPGLTSLSLSRLQPNSSIERHRGDTNAVIRCHLGIEIPASLPACGIKVGEEEKGWEEGNWTLFNDAYIHSAWNNTDKRRVVMIIDMVRPDFLRKKNSICARLLTYQILDNQLGRKKSFKDSSWFVKNVLFSIVFALLMVYRPLQNFAKQF